MPAGGDMPLVHDNCRGNPVGFEPCRRHAARQVDLLGIHEVALVEALDGTERVLARQESAAHRPADLARKRALGQRPGSPAQANRIDQIQDGRWLAPRRSLSPLGSIHHTWSGKSNGRMIVQVLQERVDCTRSYHGVVVEQEHVAPAGTGQSEVVVGAEPTAPFPLNDLSPWECVSNRRRRPILRRIVDDDYLELRSSLLVRFKAPEGRSQPLTILVTNYRDRDVYGRRINLTAHRPPILGTDRQWMLVQDILRSIATGYQSSDSEQLRMNRADAYESPRQDIVAHVPESCRKVLDLGCSSGGLGTALRRRGNVTVVGVEMDPHYAADAAHNLDRVIQADVETFLGSPNCPEAPFDCLVAADVLEHLVDPWTALARATELLGAHATVVVSLPNVSHWRGLVRLVVGGRWPRDEHGPFDATHLRWFTRKDAIQLLHGAGLVDIRAEPRYWTTGWRLVVHRLASRCGFERFVAIQYVLSGRTGA